MVEEEPRRIPSFGGFVENTHRWTRVTYAGRDSNFHSTGYGVVEIRWMRLKTGKESNWYFSSTFDAHSIHVRSLYPDIEQERRPSCVKMTKVRNLLYLSLRCHDVLLSAGNVWWRLLKGGWHWICLGANNALVTFREADGIYQSELQSKPSWQGSLHEMHRQAYWPIQNVQRG